MDRITKSLLEEFVKQSSLESLSEDRAFEHFAGYLMTGIHYPESFSTEDISVGAGNDCGIDCMAVLVNGRLVTEPDEIEDLADTNGFLDVTFVFVQAERSNSFDASKIGSFGFGVRDFFAERPTLPQNDAVQEAAAITNEIFRRSSRFKRGNPRSHLYYVTTGKWVVDTNLEVRRRSVVEDLQQLNVFSAVTFDCVDAERLHKLYSASKNAVRCEIVFSERTVIPEIPGVEQAYLGLLPATEFLKLIENETGAIVSSLFYDNVRDWQDWNPVNSEIKQTLSTPETVVRFPLMNNGVTIVARNVMPTGNRFTIEDYQIVNGCQTSYVLHACKEHLTANVLVPVRLIATQDEEVKNAIIKATNRQTTVSEDQLFALSDFPKKLEMFFPTFDGKKKLHYERRSRQYSSTDTVEKVRIVNQTALVRAFAAMFLEKPHSTTRNYKALLKTMGTDIFGKEHRLEPYYVAAYASHRLEFLFRSQVLNSKLKPARYHLLLAARLLADPAPLPRFNSNEMGRYCEKLQTSFWQDEVSKTLFEKAVSVVQNVSGGNLHRDHIRTEPFTETLIRHILGTGRVRRAAPNAGAAP